MGRYPRFRIERGDAPDLTHWTTRRRCRAHGAASDLVKAGLTDERKKQQGARLATGRGHSNGRTATFLRYGFKKTSMDDVALNRVGGAGMERRPVHPCRRRALSLGGYRLLLGECHLGDWAASRLASGMPLRLAALPLVAPVLRNGCLSRGSSFSRPIRVGVFLNEKRCRGVAAKNREKAGRDILVSKPVRDFAADSTRPLPLV